MNTLRILYTIHHDSETQKWHVFKEIMSPDGGYAFGTLIGTEGETGVFDNRQDAVNYVLGQSDFNRFVLTDLNKKINKRNKAARK